ncbi:MAG: hypothetical protein A3J65_04485 [Candidatus Buchananbacteria bacterium RIFCSPHIGHO2_02_FULL_45_11b]|uniref:TIGR00374 family protein n=1 Tax=Candidatus Buchananbacteria bacterium RIFCSPHIGHO2_02_FULL_45_11b TaxID=1797541 RepID=A0A1G1YDA9_9BACT|nr:MAG: hypothetical protein A3J65_04485 [Candidatus Buchananbacteria bacterium RIFCSPHIGHO2_02_FULL_45_11b]
MPKIKDKKKILKLAGILLFLIIIFTQIDFKELYSVMISLNPWRLALASLLSLSPVLIKMFRWQYILQRLNVNCRLAEAFRIYFLSIILGLFTPLNAGDFIGRSAFLKKGGYRIKTSFLGTVIDRIADLAILLLITAAGTFFLFNFFKINFFIVILAIILTLIVSFIFSQNKYCQKIMLKIFFLIVPEKYQNYLKENIKEIICDIKSFKISDILAILAITFLSQLANLGFLYLLLLAVGIAQIPILSLFFFYAIISLITLIPITIGGFGTREATFIAFFSIFGVANERTITFSLLIFFLSLIPLLFIGLYLLIKKNKA